MALLPGNMQITEIGDGQIAIIDSPGYDDEKVLFKYDGRNSRELVVMKDKIFNSDLLTDEQKFYAGFWMGYFYAHLAHKGV
jgi:hypothetical protein